MSSAAVVAGLLVVMAALIAVRLPLSVVYPISELRSYDDVPTAIVFPAFHAGPIAPGNVVDQEIRLSERDVAVRLWLGPARAGEFARARIELLAGPHGPSLRSGVVDLPRKSAPIVARILPPVRASELTRGDLTRLRIAPVAGSQPVRVGMSQGKAYRHGGAYVNGEALAEHHGLLFGVARELSARDIWSQIWDLIFSETFPLRAGAVAGAIVLVSGLAAGLAEPRRRVRVAVLVGVVTLIAVALVVVDRTALSFFPGPDFKPDVILR